MRMTKSISVDSQDTTETHNDGAVDRNGRDGQNSNETRRCAAVPADTLTNSLSVDSHPEIEAHEGPAVGRNGGGHSMPEAQSSTAAPTNSISVDSHVMAETHARLAVDRNGRDGLSVNETHGSDAVPADNSLSSDGQTSSEAHPRSAIGRNGRDGHVANETHEVAAVPAEIIAELVMLWRRRRQWHSAEKILTLQCGATCRGWCAGDKKEAKKMLDRIEAGEPLDTDAGAAITLAALLDARSRIKPQRLAVEKTLKKLVHCLPVWEKWVVDQKGCAEISLASIIGETGDLGNYSTVSKVWKRMGLAVIDGERQRKVASKEGALAHGYSPARRSVAWNLGECLVKAKDERWRALYLRDKEKQLAKGCPPWLANKRAKRYMTKKFLASLWGAWNGRGEAITSMKPSTRMPLSDRSADA